MNRSSVASHLRVEVKHRCTAPKRYTWEIFSEGKMLPLEESTDQFHSWEEASQAGKKALKKLIATSLPQTKAINSNEAAADVLMHKFKIGQTVYLERSLAVPGGAYVITKKLPERDGEFEYRIKSVNEPHERVVRESQLKTDF